MYLRFNVESQHLTRTDRSIVVARSENYLKAKFDFSPDWDGVTKTGVFTNGGRVYNVILDNDECFVPTEVIRKGCFTVSVFGGDLITADVVTIRVEPSGYEIGGSPEPPTPEVYEQILGMFDKFRGGEDGQVLAKSSDDDLEFEWVEQGGGGGGTAPRWGNIAGTLSNQTDLQAALDAKENAADAFDGNYENLTNKPALFSGDYRDLTNKPELFSGDYNDLSNKPTLFSGNYNDLTNKPDIPSVEADPTLSGTEPTLEGIEIDGERYKIGGAIDDANISALTTYSSEKIDDLLTTESGNVLPTGMISGKAIKNWGAGSTTYNDLQDNAQYYTYPIVEVEPNTEYSVYLNTNYRFTGVILGFYDADGVAISFLGNGNSIIAPPNAKYIRFSTKSANVTQVRKGNDEKVKSENYGTRYDRYLADDTVAYKMHYIYVSTTGSNVTGDGSKGKPYASVYFANNQITDNSESNRYTILVNPGTYDMSAEISGVPAHEYEGIIAKDYVYYESVDISRPDLTTIYLDGSDGLSGADLTDENLIPKCIFHFVGNKEDSSKRLHTHVKGMTLESTNARYGLHGETAATVGQDVLHENIIVKFHGKPALTGITTSNILGYGMVCNDHITFRNCKFVVDGDESSKRTFIAHDNNLKDSNINKIGGVVTFEYCDMLGLLNHLMHTATSLASVDVPFLFRCIGCTNVGTVNIETNWGKYVETIATT